jgi:hypothetical protein
MESACLNWSAGSRSILTLSIGRQGHSKSRRISLKSDLRAACGDTISSAVSSFCSSSLTASVIIRQEAVSCDHGRRSVACVCQQKSAICVNLLANRVCAHNSRRLTNGKIETSELLRSDRQRDETQQNTCKCLHSSRTSDLKEGRVRVSDLHVNGRLDRPVAIDKRDTTRRGRV